MLSSYYHGGRAGLKVGEYVLPPSVTGVVSTARYGAPARRDRVYLTTDKAAAMMFASLAPAKTVAIYRVEPEGLLTPDPDCKETGLSWECPRATILEIIPLGQTDRKRILSEVFGGLRLVY